MQVRRLEAVVVGGGVIVGAMLTPETLHGDPARLLSTFLGLVSASILPSVSLILATMTPGSRSVESLNRLNKELSLAVDSLFLLLGSVGIIFAALFMLGVDPPNVLRNIPFLTSQIFPRFGQAVVVSGVFLILFHVGKIPNILRRSLSIRHEIAVDEARRKTMENAAKIGAPRSIFPRVRGFGDVVKVAEKASDQKSEKDV